MNKFTLIDTHTGGEPTRVVFSDTVGAMANLPLSSVPPSNEWIWEALSGRDAQSPVGASSTRSFLRDRADFIRRSLVTEPRGSEFMVGAWVTLLRDRKQVASVVFFNNVGYLGMCGHGLIGVVEAMRYHGLLQLGQHCFDTPVGDVSFTLNDDLSVTFDNVPSYRYRKDVSVSVKGASRNITITGDIAYSGNWFFLVDVPSIDSNRMGELLTRCLAIRDGLREANLTGKDGDEIDHVELGGSALIDLSSLPASARTSGGRNFVLCPGGHYDRSPCGTGTSAKVACLAADGKLREGETWVQESVIGSRFTASFRNVESPSPHASGSVIVSVTGRAYVTADSISIFDSNDPFRYGIHLAGPASRASPAVNDSINSEISSPREKVEFSQ